MKKLLKELKSIENSKEFPPEIYLKEDVKNLVHKDSRLRTSILHRFEIRERTLFNWTEKNHPIITSITFLVLLLNHFQATQNTEYQTISDLLTLLN